MRWAGELIGWLWRALRSVLRGIGRLIVLVWRVCRASWLDVGHGLRPNSLASAAYLFLIVMLCGIGLILVLMGFDLADVDRWLDRRTGWWELIGSLALKLVWGALLAGCLLVAGLGVYERLRRLASWVRPGTRAVAGIAAKQGMVGWGFLVTAVILGYFSVFGLIY